MPTFTIHQKGTIRGIPSIGPKRHFLPGDTYTPVNNAELSTLRKRPDYVATELPGNGSGEEPGLVEIPILEEPSEPSQLEIAQQKQAFRDDLVTTPQNKLMQREFEDGSPYKTVWKYGMKKVEFVDNIMEKIYG